MSPSNSFLDNASMTTKERKHCATLDVVVQHLPHLSSWQFCSLHFLPLLKTMSLLLLLDFVFMFAFFI